jgi:hypothetical protein
MWSLRVERLWQALLAAELGSIVLFALAGGIARMFGGRGNTVFVAARYVFPFLAWGALLIGLAWGGLAWGRHGVRQVDTPGGAVMSVPGSRPVVRALIAFVAVVLMAFILVRRAIPGVQRPWTLPYEIAEWYFDDATMSFASDECLAFRATDDVAKFGTSDPGHAARVALRRSEHRAVPGVAAFLADRLTVRELCYGAPCGVTTGLLAFLAETGDHPLLAEYEAYPVLQMREIRACLHSGRQVKWAGPLGWKCLEPEQLPRAGVE